MKKVVSMTLALVMAASLAACGGRCLFWQQRNSAKRTGPHPGEHRR